MNHPFAKRPTKEMAMRKKKLLQNTLFATMIACALYLMHTQPEAESTASSATWTAAQAW